MSDRSDQAVVYLDRLLSNAYVQENLSEGIERLRSAYRRGTRRGVEPTRDEKLRQQMREAAASIKEAVTALRTGREKPKPRWGRRILVAVGLGAAGAAAVLAANEELRNKLFGPEPEAPHPASGVTESPPSAVPA